ncbi:hypothetical protein BU16DRAFT_584701 [Lophium mytilinum]|uniref:Uncharacterized protein n=1 Tax=Lophium mytilinum TaxID=390894 RepID=A0A6A6QH35_9PEZI|nr:hypothetical protein BU16DRAFT_584701 [Lophium mytilinum]
MQLPHLDGELLIPASCTPAGPARQLGMAAGRFPLPPGPVDARGGAHCALVSRGRRLEYFCWADGPDDYPQPLNSSLPDAPGTHTMPLSRGPHNSSSSSPTASNARTTNRPPTIASCNNFHSCNQHGHLASPSPDTSPGSFADVRSIKLSRSRLLQALFADSRSRNSVGRTSTGAQTSRSLSSPDKLPESFKNCHLDRPVIRLFSNLLAAYQTQQSRASNLPSFEHLQLPPTAAKETTC